MNERINKLKEEIEAVKKELANKNERLDYVYKYLEEEENQYEIDGYYTMMQQKDLLLHDIKILSAKLEKLTRRYKKLAEQANERVDKIKSKLNKAKEQKEELELEYAKRYSAEPGSHLVYNPNVNQREYDRKKKKIKKTEKLILLLTEKLETEKSNTIQQ